MRLWLQAAEMSFAERQGEEISHAARAQNRELLSSIDRSCSLLRASDQDTSQTNQACPFGRRSRVRPRKRWAVNALVFLWKSRRRWRRCMVLIFMVKSINGGAWQRTFRGAFCTLTAFIWSYETWKQKELRELQILFNTTALQLSQQECIVMEAHPPNQLLWPRKVRGRPGRKWES